MLASRKGGCLIASLGLRHFLSDAYACSEAWNARLQLPLLKKIDIDNFIVELKRRVEASKPGNAIDLDVAVNCATSVEHLKELKALIYKVRHSKVTARMLPSTHHAFVRACLTTGSDQLLMQVLSDPINYGIFPDAFASNLAVDHFLKAGKFAEAAKLSSDMMKQEEFRPSVCWLSILSCVKWLCNATELPWLVVEEDELAAAWKRALQDDVVFRVPYLKNPVPDHHFDLTQPRQLVAKTLDWMCREVNSTGPAIVSARVLGASLYANERLVTDLLQTARSSGQKLCKDITDILKAANSNPSLEPSETVENCIKIIDTMGKDILVDTPTEETLLEEMQQVWPELQQTDVEDQLKLYAQWNQRRSELLDATVRILQLQQRLQEIEEHERQLAEQEELFFFFQNKTKWEQQAQRKLQHDAESAERTAGNIPSDDAYTVPELEKRTTEYRRKTF